MTQMSCMAQVFAKDAHDKFDIQQKMCSLSFTVLPMYDI